MQLRCTSVVQYLLETGWLSRATLVRSRLEVVPIGRRNNNFRVTNGDIELFVKQVHRNEQGAWLTVWREGVLYSEVAARPHLSPLRSLVPRFLGWDPERGVVLTELVRGSTTLLADQGAKAPSPERFAVLGRALGLVHGAPGAVTLSGRLRQTLTARAPWILSLVREEAPVIEACGPAARQFLSFLAECPTVRSALDWGLTRWTPDAFVHGDLRWDNILVQRESHGSRIVFADWELYDIGDSGWDIAAVLKDWLISQLFRPDPSHDARTAMTALLREYLAARPELRPVFHHWRERTAAFAVAHLAISAFEHLVARPESPHDARRLLAGAEWLARQPQVLRAFLPAVDSAEP